MTTYFKFQIDHKKPGGAYARITLTLIFCLTILLAFVESAFAQANIPEEQIDRFIRVKMEENHIPGLAVAITRDDQVIFAKGYGKTADQRPISADTPLAIASLSKSFTALAVMQLAESGRVDLDKPIAHYIPSFQMADPRGSTITVRQLLSHTSGLTDTAYPDMTIHPQPNSLEEVVQRLHEVTLHNDPGSEFHYNNTNYQLLARLVEVVSKEKFPDYLQRHIFTPLEMNRTFDVSHTKQFGAMSGTLSKGHYFLFGKPIATAEPEWFVEGAAGMVSTVNDMAKWLIVQGNDGRYNNVQVLSSEGIRTMHSPTGPKDSYGLGWEISKTADGKKQIEHGGILWTYKAQELFIPDQKLGIVLLFNSGLNTFVDYYSFVSGLSGLLMNSPQEDSFFTHTMMEVCMGIVIMVTVGLGVRSILRLKKRENYDKQRSSWLNILTLVLRLLPLCLLLFLPKIITFLGGGRVLSLEGIFMMMPSIIIWLAIASVLSLVIVVLRAARMLQPEFPGSSHVDAK